MIAIGAGLLLLAACGDGDGGDAVAADEAPISQDEWRELPLSQAMGWDEQFADNEEEWEAQEREVQELTAECMAELGFEYQPVDHGGVVSFDPYEDIDVEPGSREFVERFGFGMLAFFEEEQQMFGPGSEDDFVDPNQDYVESLSESERMAYYDALHGQGPEIDESLSDEEINELLEDFVPTGCENDARSEVFGGFGPGQGSDAMQEFNELQQDLHERTEAHPRVVEARAEWRECMSDAGYDFADETAMYDAVSERTNEVYETQVWPGNDLSPEEWESLSEEELEALQSQPVEYDEAVLEEARAYEIEVAVANFDCGAESQRVWFEARRELEAEFVEQHADLIDEVRDEFS